MASITKLEKLELLPIFFTIVGRTVSALVTGPFRGAAGASTFVRHVLYAMVRAATTSLSSVQSQYVQILFVFRGFGLTGLWITPSHVGSGIFASG